MRVFRNLLWLVVVLLVLQVIKVILSRQGFAGFSLLVIIVGCLQFLLVQGALFVWLCAWVFKRFLRSTHPVRHALMAFTGVVIGVECLLAWWMHHPQQLPKVLRTSYGYYYDYFQEDLLQFDKRYAVYDPGLFYTLKPGARFNFSNIEFSNEYRTNRLGMRDEDSSLRAPEVVCIGDSYTMGWGVEQSACYPSKLRDICGLRVANMGMASYGTARELASLGRVDTSRMQWLIIQYCTNDQDENRGAVEHGYRLPISSAENYADLVRAAADSRIYFPGKYSLIIGNFFEKSCINKLYPFFKLRWERRDWGKQQEEQARVFLDVLSHAAIDFNKVRVIVTMMDDHRNMKGDFLQSVQQLYDTGPYKARFGAGLKVVNVEPLLSKKDLYTLDVHFRASAHIKIAWALLNAMKSF